MKVVAWVFDPGLTGLLRFTTLGEKMISLALGAGAGLEPRLRPGCKRDEKRR